MDNRSVIAIAFCVIFYLAYSHYLSTKYPKTAPPPTPAGQLAPGQPAQGTAATPAATPGAPAVPGAPAAPVAAKLSAADLRLDTDLVTFQFSQEVGGLAAVQLKKFKSDISADAGPMDLLDGPMAVQGTADIKNTSPVLGVFSAERHGRSLRFWRDAGDFRIAQEWTVPNDGYGVDLKVTFTNISGKPVELTGGLLMSGLIIPKKSPAILGIIPGTVRQRDTLIYNADNSTDWLDVEKFCKDDKDAPKLESVPVKYFGLDRHYFLTVLEPKAKTGSLRFDHGKLTDTGCSLAMIDYDKQGLVQPNDTATLDFSGYFGPKDLATMTAHSPELEGAMHLGTFGFIGRPLLVVIQGFEHVTHNYGVAIILLTMCLKALFYPLVRASSISMHKMKKLNPQMQAIKDKFKDDKQKQQMELMKFMQGHKINPMKGCLPILPQIPVFFAFYQVLQTSIQLRHAPFYGWIHDLSTADPYFVTPLLMGLAMLAQQKLTPTSGMDKTQEKILMFMPIMFTVMMLTLPAGLTLYMLTNTTVGIAQQKWLYHKLDKRGA